MKTNVDDRAQNQSQNVATTYQKDIDADIIDLILEDHKPLKRLIETMKDLDCSQEERMAAYGEFEPLLVAHAKPEEQTLYEDMKQQKKSEIREEGLEGTVEHMLADQLLEEIKRTADNEAWSAKVKVLAELVEHHIEEEESTLLPSFKKNSDLSERKQLAQKFIDLKSDYELSGSDDAPSEKFMDQEIV